MRLLLFSDVHCSQPAVQRLVRMAEDVDVLVGAGDFGTMRRGTAETLAPFQETGKPVVLTPGNGESLDELREAAGWPNAHPVHGSGVELEEVSFFGFGGGVPVTPFGSWSYDFSEEQCADGLASCPPGCVLVVHSPPRGVVDVSSRGQHLGSVAIRDAIAVAKPQLVVCGHIHDCAGQVAMLDTVPVVNAGPDGVVWDLVTGSRVHNP